jgi:hypothetical protein
MVIEELNSATHWKSIPSKAPPRTMSRGCSSSSSQWEWLRPPAQPAAVAVVAPLVPKHANADTAKASASSQAPPLSSSAIVPGDTLFHIEGWKEVTKMPPHIRRTGDSQKAMMHHLCRSLSITLSLYIYIYIYIVTKSAMGRQYRASLKMSAYITHIYIYIYTHVKYKKVKNIKI